MKTIVAHRSWNWTELVEIFRDRRGFTMCNLPHYRYARVKQICLDLAKCGAIRRVSTVNINVHWTVSESFDSWYEATKGNRDAARKLYKEMHPPKPPKPLKIRKCKTCHIEYMPSAPQQKFCARSCSPTSIRFKQKIAEQSA